jgi:serine/threonine protein kinase
MSTNLQRLKQYEVQERLGSSSIAETWRAFDSHLKRPVALKIFAADLQHDPVFMTRFWNLPFSQEAQKILALRHPNIVHVHGFEIARPTQSESPLAYVVLDYVEGRSLADYLRDTSHQGAFPPAAQVVQLFASIGTAIDYAHQQGVIHGDIKPTNILLDAHDTSRNPMGEPKLNDIGITKLLGTSTGALGRLEPDAPSSISPEQAQGHPANERSDIYALGVILSELCAAALPVQGENDQANASISPALSAVIQRSLATEPAERFPSAASLVAALAQALDVAVPETLSQPGDAPTLLNGQTDLSPTLPTSSTEVTSPVASVPLNGTALSSSEPSIAENKREGDVGAHPPTTTEEPSVAHSPLPPLSAPWQKRSGTSVPPPLLPATAGAPSPQKPPSTQSSGGPLTRTSRLVFLFILLVLLVASTLGALLLLALRHPTTPASSSTAPPIIGHVYFLSSGHLYVNNNQGLNDEVLIDLHPLAAPAPGKSYYAWLLGDINQSEVPWVALGKVSFSRGDVHFLYSGDQAHTNLLNDMSRFLLTEGDANTAPDNPLLDPSAWRYFGVLDQIPSVKDPNHFSLLDHLRHLLVQAPELKVLGLSGGLSIWMMRNVEEIAKWALIAKERWESKDSAGIRQYLVNILYYLDGECTRQADLQGLPPVNPTLPENQTIARIAHFALLNPCIQEEQEQANALKQVFLHVPHNYVDHLLFHMAGVIQSPGASAGTQALALQINGAINAVKARLLQARQDAEQVLHLSDDQLVQLAGLDLLSDLQVQARDAYAGQTDQTTGNVQEGVVWIYENVERLATFDVTPYAPK